MIPLDTIIQGDCLEELRKLPSEAVDCCITSPPYYGLRDYGVDGQIGLEESPEAYVSKLVEVFREVRRVLKKEGTLWLNLGDSYAGSWGNAGHRPELDNSPSRQRDKKTEYFARCGWDQRREVPPNQKVAGCKPKDLIGIPWAVAFALRADGWYLRQDIIWSKNNCMPESVTDRCTKSHEYIFLFAKSQRYYFNSEAIKEPSVSDHPSGNGFKRPARVSYQNPDGTARGNDEQWQGVGGKRNKRSVWQVNTVPYREAHFATFPPALIEPCILAGCPDGGIVLDPFFGAGTTGVVAKKLGRHFVGIELNGAYIDMAQKRIAAVPARLDRWAEA